MTEKRKKEDESPPGFPIDAAAQKSEPVVLLSSITVKLTHHHHTCNHAVKSPWLSSFITVAANKAQLESRLHTNQSTACTHPWKLRARALFAAIISSRFRQHR